MNAFAGYISLSSQAVLEQKIHYMAENLVRYQPDEQHFFGDHRARFVQLVRYNTPESKNHKPHAGYLHDIRLDGEFEGSDADFALNTFKKHGVEGFKNLRGDFALALWDNASGELTCLRDAVGQRLLYYTYRPGKFLAFATTIRALTSLPEIRQRANQDKASEFLMLMSSAPEQTFYQDIHRLAPGHSLHLTRGQLTTKKFSHWPIIKPIHFAKPQDYEEAFLELFASAIKSRSRSLYPIGAHLSGGLDSSSVAALAAQMGQTIHTYSAFPPIGFTGQQKPGWNLDDTHHVLSLTRKNPNLKPTILRSENKNLFSNLNDSYPYLDGPPLNPWNRVWTDEIFEAAAKNNVRTLLSGAMGNATISWHGHTVKQQLGRLARQSTNWLGRPWAEALKQCAISEKAASAKKEIFHRHHWRLQNPRMAMVSGGLVQEALAFFSAERAIWGIEVRDPTHDQALVEFCLGLPNNQFVSKGMNRSLIRRSMKGFLSEEIRLRVDKGDQLSHWPIKIDETYHQMKEEWAQLAVCPTVSPLVDAARLSGMIETWPKLEVGLRETKGEYRTVWLRAFFLARYVSWIEHGGRRKEGLGSP
ncbi:MAG: asparagine synthase-related protein [Myxococcota bacterium]